MKSKLLVVFFLLNCSTLWAQNLVINGDFETYIGCPGGINGHGIQLAIPWVSALPSTPAYFNICSTIPYYSVPINLDSLSGYQWPHSGNGYAGFNYYSPNGLVRWYALIELNASLTSGNSYCLTFYVNLLNYSQYGIDAIGAHFSPVPDTCTTPLFCLINVVPQVSNPSGNIIVDTLGWTKIEGCFTADGGEKYLTIGNFKTDAQTQKAINRPSFSWSTFYYLDDVSLVEDSTLSFKEVNEEENIFIFPNPADDKISIQSKNEIREIALLDMKGEILLKTKFTSSINVSNISNGIYLIKCSYVNGEISYHKVNIVHE